MPEATSIGALVRDPTRPLEPYGVRGWLAFFCVSLFLGVFFGVVQIVRTVMVDSLESIDAVIELAIDTAYTGFAAYTVLALVHVWRNALHVARLFCLVNFVLRLLDILGMAMDENWTGTKLGISRAILTGAWVAYFYLSDRVQNTYARPNVAAVSDEFR
jgi:hypothetical protein